MFRGTISVWKYKKQYGEEKGEIIVCSVNGNTGNTIEYLKFEEYFPVLWFLQSNISNLRIILLVWKVLSDDFCSLFS